MAAEHQKPIDSGFQAKSEPADILADIDLTGKNAIVTGGYSGSGLETVRALAAAGAPPLSATLARPSCGPTPSATFKNKARLRYSALHN